MAFDVTGTIATLINVVLWILGIGFVGIISYVIIQEKKYCNFATIKDCVNGNKITIRDKFKIRKDSDGTVWWRLKKLKVNLPPQPNEVVEVTNKGKLSATWYRLEGDNFVASKDGFNPQDVVANSKILNESQPFTTNQRALMVNQHKKGIRDKKTSILGILEKAIVPMTMVLLVVCVMIFWGEFIQPMNEAATSLAGKMTTVSENLAIASDKLDAAINNRVTTIAVNNNLTSTEVPD